MGSLRFRRLIGPLGPGSAVDALARARCDARQALDGFGGRVREQPELDRAAADLEHVVGEKVLPAHVSLGLRPGARA